MGFLKARQLKMAKTVIFPRGALALTRTSGQGMRDHPRGREIAREI